MIGVEFVVYGVNYDVIVQCIGVICSDFLGQVCINVSFFYIVIGVIVDVLLLILEFWIVWYGVLQFYQVIELSDGYVGYVVEMGQEVNF